jgi:hypothetical protein
MEINITNLIKSFDPYSISASIAELGNRAAEITWGNALGEAENQPLLTTEEQLQAARDHFKSYGAWSRKELAEMTDLQINALLIQDVAASIREFEHLGDDGDIFDPEVSQALENGDLSGRVYPSGDQAYYYLGM